MMGREPLPTLGNVSWHLAGHYKIIVLDPSLPRHGRCWAKPIQSGHAVQRKRCGSLNLSFSYWEAALNRRPFFQSLQALIGGAPVPGRIQLFQRNSAAKMERVLRRPLGRAFSSKILGMKVKSCKQHSFKSPRGVPDGPTSPATWSNMAPRWANIAPT